MIKLVNLNKYYNKNQKNEYHVIDNISYNFPNKGLYVFFGPSGCGKTTLLNVIGCLDTFDSGSIEFFDCAYNNYKSSTFDEIRDKNIGYIFQNYNLVETKTVYENVELSLNILGLKDSKDIKRRVEYALDSVGLLKYRKRNVLALSGGQRQRVAIARALVKDPKIVIADEPTGNLDSNNTFEVMNIIKMISKDRLVILVSHEKNLVDHYADVILELKDGKIINETQNISSSTFVHDDVRNIYLKDYNLTKINESKIEANVYSLSNEKPLNVDIIIKDNNIYIRNNSSSKINLLDSSSEIKLIDSHESDFEHESELKSSNFSLNNLELKPEEVKEKNNYLGFFYNFKHSFSKHRFLKRSKLINIAMIFSAIIFTFLFFSITQLFNFDKKSYTKVSQNTIAVQYKRADMWNEYDYEDIVKDAKNVSGFKKIRTDDLVSSINYEYGNFYQLSNNYYNILSEDFETYILFNDSYNYDISCGNAISGDNQVIISKWMMESILGNNYANTVGLTDPNKLLDKEVTIKLNGVECVCKIVGIFTEETPTTIVSNNIASIFTDIDPSLVYLKDNDIIYIDCLDKELMINTLKEKYQKVYDPTLDAKKEYISQQLSETKALIIILFVICLGLFLLITFLSRANMFKRIKDIGILRCIGARKKQIISIFAGDMAANTTTTSIITFFITALILLYCSDEISFSSMGIKLFNITWWGFLVAPILLYISNIISGTLPILFLLNKTPVEIIKKYDI